MRSDTLEEIEMETECTCERPFCQLPNLAGDFRHQMCDSMIVDVLVTKARIIWPNGTHIKECTEALKRTSEVQSDAGPYQTAI